MNNINWLNVFIAAFIATAGIFFIDDFKILAGVFLLIWANNIDQQN